MNSDEFMKDKCGGEIKENIMCMKVWEKLVGKKWELKILLDVSRKEKKKKVEKRHIKKKKVKEKKSEKKEKYKAKNVYVVGKMEAKMRMKEK